MQHQTISGRIRYVSHKPERMGQERGREAFTITRHTDGAVTIRAYCELEDPDPTVLRDVVYSLGPDGRPSDCFVRLTVGDSFMGSGWFRMTDGRIECESFGPAIGRVSQTIETNGHYHGFGTHPIIGDAYMTRVLDLSKGPHRMPLRAFLPSIDHRGATPPLIAEANLYLEYVGEETVTVEAGTFDCRHYRFDDQEGGMVSKDGAHPPYDMWVTADDAAIFVQGGVGGYMQSWYELVELNR